MTDLMQFLQRKGILRSMGPAVSFLGKVVGIAVTVLVVRIVGAGPETMPLFLALALVTFVNNVLVSLIEMQAVAELGTHPQSSERNILGGALLLGLVTAAGVGLVLLCFASFSPLAVQILPFALPLMATLPFSSLFTGYLGIGIYRGRWFSPAVASGCRTLVTIVILVVFLPRYGLSVVSIALILGEVTRLGVVASVLRTHGSLERRAISRYLRRVLVQVPSSLFGSASPAVDRYVVGILGLGSVAILDLAEKAYGFVALAFTQGVLPPLYRGWASDLERSKRNRAIFKVAFLALGGSFVVAVLATGLIQVGAPVILGSEAQAYGSTLVVASAAYLLGLAPYLAGQVLVRLIVLENFMHLLNYTAAAQMIVNIVLDLLLGPRLGLTGIALATSVVAWLGFLFSLWLATRISRQYVLQPDTNASQ